MLSIVFIGAYIWREERLKTSIGMFLISMESAKTRKKDDEAVKLLE
jgi:hypothetical protein